MVPSGIDQFDGLAAKRQPHALRVENVRSPDIGMQFSRGQRSVSVTVCSSEEVGRHPAAAAIVCERVHDLIQLESTVVVAIEHVSRHLGDAAVHVPGNVLVGHKARCIRKDCAAFDVIPMAVAVNHIPDRHPEAFGELLFHPGGKRRVDGIRKDDALRSHHEEREVVVIARPIDVALDVDDLARGPAALGH